MPIVSKLVPPREDVPPRVMYTKIDGKILLVTLVIGTPLNAAPDEEARVCLRRTEELRREHFPAAKLHTVPVHSLKQVPSRVLQALQAAAPGDAVVIWCARPDLREAVLPILQLDSGAAPPPQPDKT